MPVMPRLDRTVEPKGFPNPRLDTSAPLESFGGGQPLARTGEVIQGAAKATFDFFQEEKRKADDVVVLDAVAQAKNAYTDTLHDPKAGAYWRKGKDAFGLMDSHYGPYQKRLREIEDGLSNDEQRMLFRRQAMSLESEMYGSLQKHIGLQAGEFDEEATKSGIDVSKKKAIVELNDFGAARREVDFVERLIRKRAERGGKDSKVVEAELRAARDEIANGRIQGWMDRDMPEMAEQELGLWREDLNNPDELEKQITGHSKNKKGRALGDDLWSKHQDPQDALSEARRNTDQKTRDAAVERIEELIKETKTRKDTTEDEIHLELTNMIQASGGTAQLPPAKVARLSPEKQSALLTFKDKVLNGKDDEHDNVKWNQMMDDARNGKLATMPRSEFDTKYWSHFDRAGRSKADTLWMQSRDPKKGPSFKSALSTDDMVRTSMIEAGILDPNVTTAKMSDLEARRKGQIEKELDRKLEAYFNDNQKNAGDDIKKKFLSEILIKRVFVERSSFGLDFLSKDQQLPAAVLTEDERGNAYVPFDSIPDRARRELLNVARSRGLLAPNESDEAWSSRRRDRLERAYGAILAGERSDEVLLRILRGED